MVIRNSVFLILTLFLVSCGARDQRRSEVLLAGQISTGMPSDYKGKNGLISTMDRLGLFLDTDKDGIRDRDDFDIDNDGIPNDCDLAPFYAALGNEDEDADGIPDFCDQNEKNQHEVYRKYGILLNLNERDLFQYDEQELAKVLKFISTKTTFPSKELLTLTLTNGLPTGEYGVYDQGWKSIRYRMDNISHEEFPEILQSSWVLVHELFHFVAKANNVHYSEELPDFYPSDYSRVSPAEYFAEAETFNYFFP